MNIFDILKLMNMQNQQPQNNNNISNNPSFVNYPSDAFSQTHNNQQNPFWTFGSDNNMLPLLMSLINKNNDISKIFSQQSQKKEEKETSSPKDEILL